MPQPDKKSLAPSLGRRSGLGTHPLSQPGTPGALSAAHVTNSGSISAPTKRVKGNRHPIFPWVRAASVPGSYDLLHRSTPCQKFCLPCFPFLQGQHERIPDTMGFVAPIGGECPQCSIIQLSFSVPRRPRTNWRCYPDRIQVQPAA